MRLEIVEYTETFPPTHTGNFVVTSRETVEVPKPLDGPGAAVELALDTLKIVRSSHKMVDLSHSGKVTRYRYTIGSSHKVYKRRRCYIDIIILPE